MSDSCCCGHNHGVTQPHPPVLAYAAPIGADTSSVSEDAEFVFARQPVNQERFLLGAGAVSGLAGFIAVMWLIVMALLGRRGSDPGMVPAAWVAAVFMLGVVVFCCRAYRKLTRFGHLPITVSVRGGLLQIFDAVRFGSSPRVFRLVDVKRCTRTRIMPLSNPVPCDLHFHYGFGRTLAIHVAAARESGIIERAVADLNHLIQKAHAAVP